MKKLLSLSLAALAFCYVGCKSSDDVNTPKDNDPKDETPKDTTVTDTPISLDYKFKSTLAVGGEGAAEISAYDPSTKKLYVVNNDEVAGVKEVTVYDITNISSPVKKTSLDFSAFGAPNSVAVKNGKLAVAVNAVVKQNPGKISVYKTSDDSFIKDYTVGALPDMVTFSHDGNLLVSANEGEPNDDYTVDPDGTISIIDLTDESVVNLDFSAFNSQEATLEAQGFRVFGLNANLAADVEPEYVTISEDSKYAYVSLQENNGIAKVNLTTKTIESILPLGFKDYSASGNEIDASDKDGVKELKQWNVPIYGIYQPDALASATINGTTYIFSANEGDGREYEGTPGYTDETRVEDVTLDPTIFPATEDYQNEINLGRLKMVNNLGDTDNDGDFDAIYSYGARSFSVWSDAGALLYDSGNQIAAKTLELTPEVFNGGSKSDKRSDDKGAEPEAVVVAKLGDKYILFVGLERNNQVLQYDITNPTAPVFLNILSQPTDVGPEGLLTIEAADSPTGKALLVVSNEVSGTISFYENE